MSLPSNPGHSPPCVLWLQLIMNMLEFFENNSNLELSKALDVVNFSLNYCL